MALPAASTIVFPHAQGLESAFAASSSTELPHLPRFGGLSDLGCLDGFERDYALGEEIGSGSFGTVFAASSLHDGEEVAVKVRVAAERGAGLGY
jgi:predicted unusual protein kinase regulating ubiquinone biosynthesis (AarF/ABC1/UbiB family)